MMTHNVIDPAPPVALIPWLTHPASLTEKLKTIVTPVTLEVLHHAWVLPDTHAQSTHKLPIDAYVLQREVMLCAGNVNCWYARTLLPQATYTADVTLFDCLATQTLGDLIWNNSNIKRTKLRHYPITPQSFEYTWLHESMHANQSTLWARQSTWLVRDAYPFYLLEIFLPGLEQLVT